MGGTGKYVAGRGKMLEAQRTFTSGSSAASPSPFPGRERGLAASKNPFVQGLFRSSGTAEDLGEHLERKLLDFFRKK